MFIIRNCLEETVVDDEQKVLATHNMRGYDVPDTCTYHICSYTNTVVLMVSNA